MKNFPIEYEGKTYWMSRSIAAVCYVYTMVKGQLCVLANKRGPGVDKTGKWNCPSGFLDYDETLEECACREVFEETGVTIHPDQLELKEVDSNVTRKAQNVLVRYSTFLMNASKIRLTNENAEENEVTEVEWIPVTKVNDYEWVSDKHVAQIELYAKQLFQY